MYGQVLYVPPKSLTSFLATVTTNTVLKTVLIKKKCCKVSDHLCPILMKIDYLFCSVVKTGIADAGSPAVMVCGCAK